LPSRRCPCNGPEANLVHYRGKGETPGKGIGGDTYHCMRSDTLQWTIPLPNIRIPLSQCPYNSPIVVFQYPIVVRAGAEDSSKGSPGRVPEVPEALLMPLPPYTEYTLYTELG
jgi:hypothetical protein